MSHNYKCHFCPVCNGEGCIGELPGMGGFNNSVNFKLNCQDWHTLFNKYNNQILEYAKNNTLPEIRLAPITGGVENIGYDSEKSYYMDMIEATFLSGAKLSIGDGCPDEKILDGIEAVKKLQNKYKETENNQEIKAAVFIKP